MHVVMGSLWTSEPSRASQQIWEGTWFNESSAAWRMTSILTTEYWILKTVPLILTCIFLHSFLWIFQEWTPDKDTMSMWRILLSMDKSVSQYLENKLTVSFFFPRWQILIEFCAGGAVDAVMLGESAFMTSLGLYKPIYVNFIDRMWLGLNKSHD